MEFSRIKGWRKLLFATQGSEVAEFSLVLPIVMMLLMAIIFFGRAYNVYTTITYAAREGASVAVVGTSPSCATCGAAVPTAAKVQIRIAEVLQASHIDATQIQSYVPTPAPVAGSCGGMTTTSSNNVTLYRNAQLNAATSNPPACGVIVSFRYPFTFFSVPFTSLDKQTIHLNAAAQMQGEN